MTQQLNIATTDENATQHKWSTQCHSKVHSANFAPRHCCVWWQEGWRRCNLRCTLLAGRRGRGSLARSTAVCCACVSLSAAPPRLLYLNWQSVQCSSAYCDTSAVQVGDEGLVALQGLTQLRALGLAKTGVTDDGMRVVARLTKLRTLSLAWTDLHDEGEIAEGHIQEMDVVVQWNGVSSMLHYAVLACWVPS